MSSVSKRSRRRYARHLLPAVGLFVTLAETGVLRARVDALAHLDGPPDQSGDSDVVWCCARGVSVPAAVRRAAESHLVAHDLEWLDVVPVDLPIDRLFELLRAVDPARFRTSATAPGRSAGKAMVMSTALAERIQLDGIIEDRNALRPVEFVSVAVKAKWYAPTRCDHAVARSFSAGRAEPFDLDELSESWGPAIGLRMSTPIIQAIMSAGGLAARSRWGVAFWLSVSLQPILVTAANRGGLQPMGLGRDVATHAFRPGIGAVRALLGAQPSSRRQAVDAARPAYEAELALGTDRFLGERRSRCPWCESSSLRPLIQVGDLLQQKPGTFEVDRCADCGHVFQNPEVNAEGLSFYYRDFYDGLSADKVELGFGTMAHSYRGRTAMVRRQTRPRTWLDVGGGHGHFCLVAREEFPDTTFEALDQSDSIDEAKRRGWVDEAHKGAFLELAPGLEGRFDVVSMHHYLEHTTDPKAELDAAAKILPAGGYLLIELPDPEFSLARPLGRWWMVYLQPQHLHLMPLGNLEVDLRRRGFEIVDVERAKAHQGMDLLTAAWTATRLAAPPTDLPWLPARTPGRVARQVAAYAAASPALGAAIIADLAIRLALRNSDHGNTYRLLARRTAAPAHLTEMSELA